MHIGEVAERSGLSSRTLRHYEQIGLLVPSERTDGGFRVYSDEDMRRLMTIRRMKALSYSTSEMGRLLELLDIAEGDGLEAERRQARAELDAMQADAQARRAKLARDLERADEFLGILAERLA